MTTWDADRILAESAKWHWIPPGATEVETDQIHLYVNAGAATLIRADPDPDPAADPAADPDPAASQGAGTGTAAELAPEGAGADSTPDTEDATRRLIMKVADLARRHGADRVMWGVGPDPRPANLLDVLQALGGEVTVTLDVCAYDLTTGLPTIPVPEGVTAGPVATREDTGAAMRVGAMVWGGDEPTDAEIDKQYDNLGDEPGLFLARHADEPAGSGGYTLAGPVARLWGAGVLPALRGNGAYRALVAARLRDAVARGVTLALVHANVGTSAPILRRLGFTVYGQRQIVTLLIR
ncbi:GNAT family N-acetyltransferase [Actinopolymorpha sp. B9G3]|uniref:GNAT family N-acetyltransferase n=1 Tax=Actinopolymorpha sp. B9G3 TaxID=3158970 RepID=UPI0032D98B9B